ncbi:hypothetical protein BU197_20070 [Streptomyces sp. CBMA291]|nr:hypothetical protein [Streptomyces sp. CBMA291]
MVVVPWLLALAVSVLCDGTNGLLLPAGTRMVLILPLLAAETVAVVAAFRRYDALRPDFWPGAGLAFALLALFTLMAVAATWGEGGALLGIWAFYSGYVFFVFGFGGRAWRKAFTQAVRA